MPLPGPTDPAERTEELCRAIERFAPFQPEVVLTVTGHPGEGADPVESRRVLVDGMRQAARVAAANGLTLGLEPLHRNVYGTWSTIGTIPETIDLIDEIGEPNVKVLYDVYHLWDTDDVLEHTARHGDRISPSIHICDWRERHAQRLRPRAARRGRHRPAGAVRRARRRPAPSSGSTSRSSRTTAASPTRTSRTPSGSRTPRDVIARSKAGFEAAWEARTTPA